MFRKSVFAMAALALTAAIILPATADAFFVATAKNFRGALYQGVGPTPGHASEMAIVKCSQDSFAPRSCRVVTVRMECPPPVCAPKKTYKKTSYKTYQPAPYSVGRPMQQAWKLTKIL